MDYFNENVIFLQKNLDAEFTIKENVAFFRLAGESNMENYCAPDAYVFIIFEKCSGTHIIDFIKYEEKDLQIHVSYPRQIHSWNTNKDAKGYKLIISKKFVEKFLFDTIFIYSKVNSCPVIDISPQILMKLKTDLQKLEEELLENEIDWKTITFRTQLIIYRINKLIVEIEESKEKKLPLFLRKFYEEIDIHFMNNHSVAFYADKIGITPNYLSMLCREYIGVKPKKVIDSHILLEAKRLLLGSDFTIKEIGYKLGFSNITQFSKFIRSKTGISARELRENIY
ncbi:hypothetical protein BAS09_03855 [Elizabethkingia ursingii]|uniref:helix-turn-helix domain-containing protein n=1 Tax=Elizabethkingia ursingii TaxID=1756150 RepID=UPI00099A1780|nr:helix-turn-helix domain-containing protein [Elizabethkingia ursingii]OPC04832.1 hypothetical protein BAS09_03855 [Elizabethkingia ursingii]